MGIYTTLVSLHEFLGPIGILTVAFSRKAASMLPVLSTVTRQYCMHAMDFFFPSSMLACG